MNDPKSVPSAPKFGIRDAVGIPRFTAHVIRAVCSLDLPRSTFTGGPSWYPLIPFVCPSCYGRVFRCEMSTARGALLDIDPGPGYFEIRRHECPSVKGGAPCKTVH